MATHYFPTDRVHFTWDTGNEPVLTVADGDTVVFETRDVSDNQIGPGLRRQRDRGPGLGPRVPARRARSTSRAPSRATRSRSRSSTSTPRAGAGRRSCPASGCSPTTSPSRTCGSSTSQGDVTLLPRGHRDPARAVHGDDGRLPGGRERAAGDAARHVRRQHGHPPARRGHDALPAGPGRRARCSSTGDAHGCQGDGEICVTGLEAPMYATCASASRRPLDPLAAVPHRARPADPGASTTARSSARPASAATSTRPRRTPRGR